MDCSGSAGGTPKYWDMKPYDETNTRRIIKSDNNCQVFTEIKAAEAFVHS
ncbi:Uncharacterised protein [Shewanella morhuae]|uniref:Uncharacterized protein n=1 Tax=Shewanella morhuae TaxID=365591 RepID=A0A380BW65_9GAMM|nr:Uncharacterised protein [Shewanella morhuae]